MSNAPAAAASAPAPTAAPTAAPASAPIESAAPAEFGQTAEAAAEKAAEKKIEAQRKKYNLKVNGKAKDVEIDLSNDAEVQKYLQKAIAADEKFQEAAITRKQMEYLVDQLRTNPLAVLQHEALGINVKELAQKVMEQEIQDLAKTPEQKRIEELEKALKAKEEKEKESEEQRMQEQRARMELEQAQALDDSISEAIGAANVPKTPYVVKQVVNALISAVEMGYVGVTAKDVMPYVEDQITREMQEMHGAGSDEFLEKLVGKKRLDGYRKARVSKAKNATEAPTTTLKQAIQDAGITAKTNETNNKTANTKQLKTKDLLGF